MTTRWLSLVLTLCFIPALGQEQIVDVPHEPTNLQAIKDTLKHYHDCPEAECYVPQLERQADVAISLLKQGVAQAKQGEIPAIVLDIDETSLSNWSVEVLDDFAYSATDQNTCVAEHCARAIKATLRIYQEARKDKIAVFFITGRPESQRKDTEINLRMEGFTDWQRLYLRPVDHPQNQTVTQYKSGARRDIVEKQHFHIFLNVGDQYSDLEGEPMADHSVKMPNPFYFIP
jgi:predicted secreted acid phosphatase